MFRRDFEQRLDRFACAIICELLQPIAQRKEKEQRRAFGPSLNEQRAERDRHHQELNVDLAALERMPDTLSGEPTAAHTPLVLLLSLDFFDYLSWRPGIAPPNLIDPALFIDKSGGKTVGNRAAFILPVNGESAGERIDLFFISRC